MRAYLSVIAASLATLTSLTVIAADDISGVALGSSLAVAKDGISKANPNFKLTPLMLLSGKEGGVTAVTADRIPEAGVGSATRPSDEFAVLQTESDKAWFVARVQRMQPGARIKNETLLASLTEKFGKPSFPTPLRHGYIWEFDRNAKQYFGPASGSPCKDMALGRYNLPSVSVSAPQSFSPTCGKWILVDTSQELDGMVSHYSVSLIDVKTMFDELAAHKSQAETERAKKLSEEQAKEVKPNL
ncbi:hypothetical protein [Pseudomonas oryzihabitans]|uniref:hypothetical protein n=1 Tax=Pseudomonas oryzihabitans TaxID=47885 RepID=UPI00135DE3E6|nr:hypothetical protein [Pseudomonas oryzihabitans]MXS21625.1 hypothetical protein [Pseudomonas oryzihabitans]